MEMLPTSSECVVARALPLIFGRKWAFWCLKLRNAVETDNEAYFALYEERSVRAKRSRDLNVLIFSRKLLHLHTHRMASRYVINLLVN